MHISLQETIISNVSFRKLIFSVWFKTNLQHPRHVGRKDWMLRSSSKCCRRPRISCSMILDILTCSPFWEEKLKLMVFRTLFTLRSIFNFSYYLHLNNKIWTQEHVQSIKLISMIELRQSRPIPHQLVKISTQLQLCTSNTDIKLQTRITFAVIPRPIPTPNF